MVAMETALLINILIYFLGARTKLKEQQKLYQYAEFQSIVISVTIFPLTNPTNSIMSCGIYYIPPPYGIPTLHTIVHYIILQVSMTFV